ncbi:F-box protein At5g07610-like [Rutidosis leptorrhynchoides]|uniref:F-box protein At5g07610-like n=1 Tax=Rutidosis leptorrhynchoides TaxID=125765 RepID=UPI003A9922AD
MDHIDGGSSQHRVIKRSNKPPFSSFHAVESNDDLLIEILIRLPVISIILSKTVSNRWLSIIRNNNITYLRHKSDPASGLYVEQPESSSSSSSSSSVHDFVPLDIGIPVDRFPSKLILRGLKIVQSCNGLLLCHGDDYQHLCSYVYYVYNPTTNMFKKPPPCPIPHCPDSIGTMRLAYDPTKSPHYKLVYARPTGNYNNPVLGFRIRIYTYSSETGIWSDFGDRYCSRSSDFGFLDYGIYWSNAIHWVGDLNYSKLCLEDLVITSVLAPEKECYNRQLFESRGCLLIACVCPRVSLHDGELNQLNVYEMSNGQSEWSIKYSVCLDEAMQSFPENWVYPYLLFSASVWCIVLGEREEDSFMVIELNGTVMQYKMMSNTLRELPYLKSGYLNHCPRRFEFIASFAGV